MAPLEQPGQGKGAKAALEQAQAGDEAHGLNREQRARRPPCLHSYDRAPHYQVGADPSLAVGVGSVHLRVGVVDAGEVARSAVPDGSARLPGPEIDGKVWFGSPAGSALWRAER